MLRPDGLVAVELGLAGLACVLAAMSGAWPAAAGSAALMALGVGCWWRGARRAAAVVTAFDRAASAMELIRVDEPRKDDAHE